MYGFTWYRVLLNFVISRVINTGKWRVNQNNIVAILGMVSIWHQATNPHNGDHMNINSSHAHRNGVLNWVYATACVAKTEKVRKYFHLTGSSKLWLFNSDPLFSYILQLVFITNHSSCDVLTLNVRGPRYLGLTRSISWLLMPWLLTSPGHQQPWYWLCRIGRFLSYFRKDFNYLRRINVEKWHKM